MCLASPFVLPAFAPLHYVFLTPQSAGGKKHFKMRQKRRDKVRKVDEIIYTVEGVSIRLIGVPLQFKEGSLHARRRSF